MVMPFILSAIVCNYRLCVCVYIYECVRERRQRDYTWFSLKGTAVFMHLYLCMFCIIALVWPIELLIQHCSHQL